MEHIQIHVLHTGTVAVAPALPFGGANCNIIKASGIFALLCVAITFHAMFNMLMKTNGLIKQFGYAVPIVSCLILFLLKYRFRKITDSK